MRRPLPRGGGGRAVWWDGELYLFGGDAGAGPLGRVDIYDPAANTWRVEAPMPTPRHAIAPALFEGRIFVAGGSPTPGHGHSDTVEVFTRQ